MAPAKPKRIYQLKATLKHIRPAIWRRVQVAGDVRLDRLHMILQYAFGWTNSHLHHFEIGRVRYGMMDADEFDEELQDEIEVKLSQVAAEKTRIRYEYAFGDGWEHEIVVEKVIPAEPTAKYPRCLDGKRACPPEDCGGPGGYENLLEAIADPKHEEHASLVEWLGGPFDPERFDVAEADRLVRSPRSRRLAWLSP